MKGGRLPGQKAADRKSRPRGGRVVEVRGVQNSNPVVVRGKN